MSGIPFILLFLVLALVAAIILYTSFHTLRAVPRNADAIVGLFAGLCLERAKAPLDLMNFFRWLHARLCASVAFAGSPLILSIATFGVVAMMPAMGQTPEVGAVWQLAVAALVGLEFLILRLLHSGISAAVSTSLALPLILSIEPSPSNAVAPGIYEVIPRPPRFLA